VPRFSPVKQKKRNFGLMFSTFFSRIACCSRESRTRDRRDRISDNNSHKKVSYVSDFFSKAGAHPYFFHLFGRGKSNLGGYNFKTG